MSSGSNLFFFGRIFKQKPLPSSLNFDRRNVALGRCVLEYNISCQYVDWFWLLPTSVLIFLTLNFFLFRSELIQNFLFWLIKIVFPAIGKLIFFFQYVQNIFQSFGRILNCDQLDREFVNSKLVFDFNYNPIQRNKVYRLDHQSLQLRKLGFIEDIQSRKTCRFKKGSLVLDVKHKIRQRN